MKSREKESYSEYVGLILELISNSVKLKIKKLGGTTHQIFIH
jgi:hypothetical protein